MAEKPASDRTEKATPERLRKARQKGQITQSQEIPSAFMIASLLVALVMTSGGMYEWFTTQVRQGLSLRATGSMGRDGLFEVFHSAGVDFLTVMTPFLLVAFGASVLSGVMVGGWVVAPKAIRLDFSKISPVKGMKNLISLRSIVKLLISMIKLATFLLIAWRYLSAQSDTLFSLQWATPEGLLGGIGTLVVGLGSRMAAALMVIAGADLLYQKWSYKRQLRMTRQEVKEERKQHEVSPEVKGRIRQVQAAMAQRQMLQDVPNADVIVTNPTHYAVAIQYDSETMEAPTMVAKGADFLCEKIKDIAAASDVPIVRKPTLARALYASVEPGQPVPETLFIAVAEILAMVYKLRKSRNPRIASAPGRGES
jgi:flagellar biosynthesis protein FlhB